MKNILVAEKNVGQRLDKFLMREIFCNEKISRGEIIRNIKIGKILLNGKTIKPSYILKEGDEIVILNSKFEIFNKLEPNKNLKIKIIFENSNFLVIDKPSGIQVHPDAHEKENTIVNWLVAKYPKIKNVHDQSRDANLRPGIVHRLDKDTSGLMVIAKNQKTFEALKDLFKNRKIKKTYVAIVYGVLKEKAGAIETALAKSANYKKQTIASLKTKTKIKPAFTGYSVLREFSDYSLVEAYLKTGRTHQIRVHLWSIGHPIVGDSIYKRKAKNEKQKAESNLVRRQLLHAEKLSFKLRKANYSFVSPVPADFKKFMATC